MTSRIRKIGDGDAESAKNELNMLLYDYRTIEQDRKAFKQEAKLFISKQELVSTPNHYYRVLKKKNFKQSNIL